MIRIPYAGFDPEEDNFEGVEMAALHEQDVSCRDRSTKMDIERARYLKWIGLSWNAVGRKLASEQGRRVAYRGSSVQFAVHFVAPASYVDRTPSVGDRPGPRRRAAGSRI